MGADLRQRGTWPSATHSRGKHSRRRRQPREPCEREHQRPMAANRTQGAAGGAKRRVSWSSDTRGRRGSPNGAVGTWGHPGSPL